MPIYFACRFIYYHQYKKFEITDNGIYRLNVDRKTVEVIMLQIKGPAILRSFTVNNKAGIMFWLSGTYKGQIEKNQIHGTEGKIVVAEVKILRFTNICLLGKDDKPILIYY